MSKGKPGSKKPPTKINLDTYEFDPSGLDLKWSKDIITVFDGYRIHRAFDLTFIENAVGEGRIGRSFVKQWKIVRTVLHRFAAISPQVPDVKKMYSRRQALRFLSLILITFAVPATVLTFFFALTDYIPYAIGFAVFAGFVMVVAWTAGHYYNLQIARAIDKYWEDNPSLLRREKLALKRWAQTTIHHTRRLMKKTDEDPDKNPIKFYNNDYESVRFANEPNWYRKHYTGYIVL